MVCTSNSDRIGVSHQLAENGYVFSDLTMVDLMLDLDVSSHMAMIEACESAGIVTGMQAYATSRGGKIH